MSASRGARVVVMGEALVHLVAPAGGALGVESEARPEVGGAAVLVARALAARGVSVALAAQVGTDAWGDLLLREVGAAGVDVTRIARGGSTGLLEVSPGPPRRMRPMRDLEAEAVDPGGFEGVSHLHVASVIPTARFAAVAAGAVGRARAAGARVSVCLNARPRLFAGVRGAWAMLAPVAEGAAWVQASEEDLEVLGVDADVVRAALAPEAWLVITRGARGATIVGAAGARELPAGPRVLADPMGAGDALSAALVRRLVAGATLDEAAEALAAAQDEALAGACEGDERAASMRPC